MPSLVGSEMCIRDRNCVPVPQRKIGVVETQIAPARVGQRRSIVCIPTEALFRWHLPCGVRIIADTSRISLLPKIEITIELRRTCVTIKVAFFGRNNYGQPASLAQYRRNTIGVFVRDVPRLRDCSSGWNFIMSPNQFLGEVSSSSLEEPHNSLVPPLPQHQSSRCWHLSCGVRIFADRPRGLFAPSRSRDHE